MATIKSNIMYGVSLCVTVKAESAWTSSNPVLKLGEIAVSTGATITSYSSVSAGNPVTKTTSNVLRVKIGDGKTKWASLAYMDVAVYGVAQDIAKILASTAKSLGDRCTTLETAKTSLESRCKTLEEAKTSLETAKTNLETRCTNLEARCTTLENSVGTMAEALIKFTSRLIQNIKQ